MENKTQIQLEKLLQALVKHDTQQTVSYTHL